MNNYLQKMRGLIKKGSAIGLFGVFGILAAHSQTAMIPAANTNTGSQRFPLGNWWGYERSTAIYTAAEIGLIGTIDSIGWYVNSLSTPAASTPVMIYMKLVPNSTITASTVTSDTTGATLVYSGPVLDGQLVVNAWTMLKLQTPFTFTGGTNNLQVTVLTNGGGSGIEGQLAKQFRYHTLTNTHQTWTSDGTPSAANGTLGSTRPNVQIFVATAPMSYTSSDVISANPPYVAKGAVKAPVVALNVLTAGYSSPLSFTSLDVSTSGTSSLSDISNLRVYYTGASPVFSSANQFGTTVAIPTFYQTINGSVNLANGNNYFWVTYDVSATATINNVIDAEVPLFNISTGPFTPATSTPSGNRLITPPLSGDYYIGVGQTYTTITSAIAALNTLGVSGPVNYYLADPLYNTLSGETFPIIINKIEGASSVNKITMNPASYNTALIEDSVSNIFTFNGTKYFTFNGQQGGTGDVKHLTIKNKHTAGSVVTFMNDAISNKLLNATFLGSANSAATIGVINFNTGLVSGNDSNLIDYCDIGGDTINSPVSLIQSAGSTDGDSLKYNDYNTVSNCNLFNFWHATSESNAFKISNGNNYWTITGNSIFQKSIGGKTSTSGIYTFNFQNSSNMKAMNGNIISNNYIGGSEPMCGGTPWKQNSAAGTMLSYFNLGNQSMTRFTHNTFANIDVVTTSTSTTGSGTWNAVQFINGMMDIDSNIIGSLTDSNSIVIRSGSAGVALPISSVASNTPGTYSISGNKLGGIRIYGGGTTSINLTLINITSATNTMTFNVNHNIIGNDLPNNIVAWPSSSTTAQSIRGINNTSSANITIANNTVHNLTNLYTSTGTGLVIGISSSNGRDTITANMINHLRSLTAQTSSGVSSSVLGLSFTSTTGGSLINQNTIYGLSNEHPTAAAKVTGLHYSGGTNDVVSRNMIHSLSTLSTSITSQQVGISFAGGTTRIQNNIIRLGIDTNGTSVMVTPIIVGIHKTGGNIRAFFNSVYIGGMNVGSGAAQTFAFNKTSSGTDSVYNNILVNERSNATTGGGHYAIGLNNNTTYSAGNNLYWASGMGDTLALFNNIAKQTISDLQVSTASDAGSGTGDPKFTNPAGDLSTLDMHINASLATPVEGSGILIPGINLDYYGQQRSLFTQTDIGAQAGNFIALDVFPPKVSLVALDHTAATSDRTILVDITDQTGIPNNFSRPILYYKKFVAGSFISATGNRVSGTAMDGKWAFTLSSSSLGGLFVDDTIFYYVVAQDSSAANNMASLPSGAVGTDVSSITTTPSSFFSFRILQGLPGATYTVGLGGTYPSLTGAGGAFEVLNNSIVSGDIVLSIVSDIEEPGTNALNELMEAGTGNYTVSIVPDMAVLRNITGSVSTTGSGLLRLSGADRVTIDGSINGMGQYLRFMNRPRTGVTILLNNDAHRDTIKNCIIEGVNNTSGTILFATTNKVGGTGNDSNAIINCIIRDTLGTIATNNLPNTGINNSGSSTAGLENSHNTIIGNEIFNFGNNAVNLTSSGTGDNWTISDNKIYQLITKNLAMSIIVVQNGGGHIINNNSIGGAAVDRSGNAFVTTSTSTTAADPAIVGIRLSVTATPVTQVTHNIISNIGGTGTSGIVNGIQIQAGSANIENNIIGGGMMPYDTVRNCYDNGMINIASSSPVTVNNNLISDIAYYKAGGDRNSGITVSAGTHTITNNTIRNIKSNGIGTGYTFLPVGVYLSGGTNHILRGNTISDIYSITIGTSAYTAAGISSTVSATIEQNSVKDIYALGGGTLTNAAQISGIYNTGGGSLVRNNQIALGNNVINDAQIYGIRDDGSGVADYRNNSIYISGMGHGSNPTYGVYRNSTSSFSAVNNLIYNNRTNDSINNAFAVGSTNAVSNANFNHNLLICADTAKLARIGGNAFGWNAFNGLYTAGPNTNWAEGSMNISPSNLFVDASTGNLAIVPSNPEAWYVNGKGLPFAGMSGDYANATGVRSVSIATGAIDIGSMEVTPTSLPPIAFADKMPNASDSTQFFFASRMLAKVNWGSGALPSNVNLRYYSGINPSNTPAGTTMMNTYWDFAPVGGSGYGYDLYLMVDTSAMGTVSTRTSLDIARYSATTWDNLTNTSVNLVSGSMMSAGLSGNLGIYTGTDKNNNPLPVRLNSFNAIVKSGDVVLSWITASEQNNRGFEVERSIDGRTFEYAGFVKGANNSNRILNYTLTDAKAFAKAGNPVLYYRLKQFDFNGKYTYSNIVSVSMDSREVSNINAYPNPYNTEYSISFDSKYSGGATVEMTDLQGRTVATHATNVINGTNTINIIEAADLKAGIYFVRLKLNGETQVFKLLKN